MPIDAPPRNKKAAPKENRSGYEAARLRYSRLRLRMRQLVEAFGLDCGLALGRDAWWGVVGYERYDRRTNI